MQELTEISGLTAALGKAGLAEGTAANTIKTTNQVYFAVAGVALSKAATDNIAMNALALQAADTTCLYAVHIDAAGAVTMAKGVEVSNTKLANGEVVLPIPEQLAAKAMLGVVKVKTVGVTFTSGTTDLSAAGITATYVDYIGRPAGPITS